MRWAPGLLLLTGCETFFPLDQQPDAPSPDAPPPKPACQHSGIVLCLPFETIADDRTPDESSRKSGARAFQVGQVERFDGEQALELKSNSDVVVDGANAFDLPGPMSIDLWVQVEKIESFERIILDNHFQYTVAIGADADRRVPSCSGQITTMPPQFPVSLGPPLAENTWHHIACVYDGKAGNLIAYVDGEPLGGQVRPTPESLLTTAGDPIQLGRAGGNDPNPRVFTGFIDNVRIWDRVLTLPEIQAFANNEEDPP